MRRNEIQQMLETQMSPQHRFVRWWRSENDFFDYELIDRFQNSLTGEEEIGGFELLTMDEMWDEVKRVAGERVIHYRDGGSDFVEWLPLNGTQMHTEIHPYSAETLQMIFDAETDDNAMS